MPSGNPTIQFVFEANASQMLETIKQLKEAMSEIMAPVQSSAADMGTAAVNALKSNAKSAKAAVKEVGDEADQTAKKASDAANKQALHLSVVKKEADAALAAQQALQAEIEKTFSAAKKTGDSSVLEKLVGGSGAIARAREQLKEVVSAFKDVSSVAMDISNKQEDSSKQEYFAAVSAQFGSQGKKFRASFESTNLKSELAIENTLLKEQDAAVKQLYLDYKAVGAETQHMMESQRTTNAAVTGMVREFKNSGGSITGVVPKQITAGIRELEGGANSIVASLRKEAGALDVVKNALIGTGKSSTAELGILEQKIMELQAKAESFAAVWKNIGNAHLNNAASEIRSNQESFGKNYAAERSREIEMNLMQVEAQKMNARFDAEQQRIKQPKLEDPSVKQIGGLFVVDRILAEIEKLNQGIKKAGESWADYEKQIIGTGAAIGAFSIPQDEFIKGVDALSNKTFSATSNIELFAQRARQAGVPLKEILNSIVPLQNALFATGKDTEEIANAWLNMSRSVAEGQIRMMKSATEMTINVRRGLDLLKMQKVKVQGIDPVLQSRALLANATEQATKKVGALESAEDTLAAAQARATNSGIEFVRVYGQAISPALMAEDKIVASIKYGLVDLAKASPGAATAIGSLTIPAVQAAHGIFQVYSTILQLNYMLRMGMVSQGLQSVLVGVAGAIPVIIGGFGIVLAVIAAVVLALSALGVDFRKLFKDQATGFKNMTKEEAADSQKLSEEIADGQKRANEKLDDAIQGAGIPGENRIQATYDRQILDAKKFKDEMLRVLQDLQNKKTEMMVKLATANPTADDIPEDVKKTIRDAQIKEKAKPTDMDKFLAGTDDFIKYAYNQVKTSFNNLGVSAAAWFVSGLISSFLKDTSTAASMAKAFWDAIRGKVDDEDRAFNARQKAEADKRLHEVWGGAIGDAINEAHKRVDAAKIIGPIKIEEDPEVKKNAAAQVDLIAKLKTANALQIENAKLELENNTKKLKNIDVVQFLAQETSKYNAVLSKSQDTINKFTRDTLPPYIKELQTTTDEQNKAREALQKLIKDTTEGGDATIKINAIFTEDTKGVTNKDLKDTYTKKRDDALADIKKTNQDAQDQLNALNGVQSPLEIVLGKASRDEEALSKKLMAKIHDSFKGQLEEIRHGYDLLVAETLRRIDGLRAVQQTAFARGDTGAAQQAGDLIERLNTDLSNMTINEAQDEKDKKIQFLKEWVDKYAESNILIGSSVKGLYDGLTKSLVDYFSIAGFLQRKHDREILDLAYQRQQADSAASRQDILDNYNATVRKIADNGKILTQEQQNNQQIVDARKQRNKGLEKLQDEQAKQRQAYLDKIKAMEFNFLKEMQKGIISALDNVIKKIIEAAIMALILTVILGPIFSVDFGSFKDVFSTLAGFKSAAGGAIGGGGGGGSGAGAGVAVVSSIFGDGQSTAPIKKSLRGIGATSESTSGNDSQSANNAKSANGANFSIQVNMGPNQQVAAAIHQTLQREVPKIVDDVVTSHALGGTI